MEPSRKACRIQGWNLNGGCKVKWKSPSKYLEICVLFPLPGGGSVVLCCSQLGWACCRPTIQAALVHITLASTNQSHELSCSEIWLLDEYEYPCFSFSQIGILAKIYAHVGFFLFLCCLRVVDSCLVCQQACQIAGQWVPVCFCWFLSSFQFHQKQMWKWRLSALSPTGCWTESAASDSLSSPQSRTTGYVYCMCLWGSIDS